MKIINRIVESTMTADEQVELMRLEDEVSQAQDEVEMGNHMIRYVEIAERNLNNYIDSITAKYSSQIVMERISTTDV